MQIQAWIQEYRVARPIETKRAEGSSRAVTNSRMASHRAGPEVLLGRVGAAPLTDHADRGVAATLSWQGSHGNCRSVTASSCRGLITARYRDRPPQLGTKGNSGIIKGGCVGT